MRALKVVLFLGLIAGVAGLVLAHHADRDDDDHPRGQGRGRVLVLGGDDHDGGSWIFGDGGYLGVHLRSPEEGRGAVVGRVMEDSPADDAGLREGDRVVSVDGDDIRSPGDLARRIRAADPGDELELTIERDGRTRTLHVKLGEAPNRFAFAFGDDQDGPFGFHLDMEGLHESLEDLHERLGDLDFNFDFDFDGPSVIFGSRSRPRLGIQVVQPTPELRRFLGGPDDAGVIVGEVFEDSAAEDAGVAVGDLIVAVDGRRVKDAGDLIRALARGAGGDVELEIVRDGRTVRLEAFIEENGDDGHDFRGPTRRMQRDRSPTPSSQRT